MAAFAGAEIAPRPLPFGQILDQASALYRGHFFVFFAISFVPQVLVLALNVCQTSLMPPAIASAFAPRNVAIQFASFLVSFIACQFSQAAVVSAISEIQEGRSISATESLRRAWDKIGPLLNAILLNFLAVLAGLLIAVLPGLYAGCRLLLTVPTLIIETTTPRKALRRSFDLTRGHMGRGFLILVFYFALGFSATLLLQSPLALAAPISTQFGKSPLMTILIQAAGLIATSLTQRMLLIATSVYYFDLRLRKEAAARASETRRGIP